MERSRSAGSDREVVPLPAEWQYWLTDNLLRGVATAKLTAVMARRGFDPVRVGEQIDLLRCDPVYLAAAEVVRIDRKLRTLADTFASQWRSAPAAHTVPVVNGISPKEFFDSFYFSNRPVVTDMARTWPAIEKWSPEFFAERFGNVQVEVTADRDADPRYEDNFRQHRRPTLLSEFVRTAFGNGVPSNDSYLVAKNGLLQQPEFAELFADIDDVPGVLDPAALRRDAKLWLGPPGTVTPLHHDASNILFVQVYGRKLVRLIEPHNLRFLHNDRECFSSVDLDDVDRTRFPEMSDVPVAEVMLSAGDALLIPIGWWHWVRALNASISLSFTGFATAGRPAVWKYREVTSHA